MPYGFTIPEPQKIADFWLRRWDTLMLDRMIWNDKRLKLRERIDGFTPPKPTLYFKGASNFQPPISQTFLSLFLARATKAILDNDPADYLVAENTYGAAKRDSVKPYLSARFAEGDWRGVTEQWMRNAAIDGVSVMWEHWNKDRTPRLEILDVSDPLIKEDATDQEQTQVFINQIKDNFEWDLLPQDITVTGTWKCRALCTKGEQIRKGMIELKEIIPAGDVGTATLEWDFDDYREGVKPEIMDPEKVLWSPHYTNPEKDGPLARLFYLPWAKLQQLNDEGEIVLPEKRTQGAIFPKPVVEGAPPEIPRETDDPTGLGQQRDIAEGVAELYAATPTDKFEIIEAIGPWDYRGDGTQADCVFWILKRTRSLIKADPLYRVYRHGKRPAVFMWYEKHDNRAPAHGIPWLLEPIEDEIYALHNMTADSAVWAMCAFGFYRPGANNQNAAALEVQPWQFLPVEDPDRDIKVININPNFQTGLQFTMFLMQLARDLIGVSEQSYGRPPKRAQGVYDTLALMQESNIRFDVVIDQWAESVARALTLWWKMEQQFAPPGLTVQVPGTDGMPSFSKAPPRKDLARMEYSVRFKVNQSAINPALQRNTQQLILSMVSNPVLMQLGLTDRGSIYNALADMAHSLGKHDVERYFSKPPEAQARKLSPEAEWIALVEGEEIRVHPMDDDEGHLQDHLPRLQNPQYARAISQEQKTRMLIHIKAHLAQMRAKRVQQQLAMMMQSQQGGQKQMQNAGVVPPPEGGGRTTQAPMTPGAMMPSSSAAGAASPMIPMGTLEPEQVTLPTNAGTGA